MKCLRTVNKNSFIRASKNSKMVRFRFTSDAIDRHRTIIEPRGLKTDSWNRVFLWGHDSSGGFFGPPPDIKNVLGTFVGEIQTKSFTRADGTRGRGKEGDVEFVQGNDRAAFAESLVRAGVLGDTSIGFRVLKAPVEEERDGERIVVFKETELLEVSLVPVASNPDAKALLRSISFDEPEDDYGWRFRDGNYILRIPAEEGSDLTLPLTQAFEALTGTTTAPSVSIDPDADLGREQVATAIKRWVRINRIARNARA